MYIQKNGFYKLEEKTDSLIEIKEWVYAFVFLDDLEKSFDFKLKKWSRLDLFWFFSSKVSENILITQEWENSELKVKFMYLNNEINLSTNVKSLIKSSNCKSKLSLTWILKKNNLSIDSSIEIINWISKVEADLKQKNLFIWESGNIRWLPKLLVDSNDVKASHSCKVEKIDRDLLFYLRSRWITENNSIMLMLDSYFVKWFKCLKMMNEREYIRLYDNFVSINK